MTPPPPGQPLRVPLLRELQRVEDGQGVELRDRALVVVVAGDLRLVRLEAPEEERLGVLKNVQE